MKKCYECNKFGNHVAKDCWQRNQNTTNRGRGRKRTERNNRNDNYLRANNRQSFKLRGQGKGNNEGNKKNFQSRSDFRKRSENSKYNWDEKKNQKQGSTSNDPKANMVTLGEGEKENEGKSHVCLSSSNDDRLYSKTNYENDCERTFVSFIADSGATEHLAHSKKILDNFNDEFETPSTNDLINFGKGKQNDNIEESKMEGEESKTKGEKKRGRGRPKKRPLDQREEENKIAKVKQNNPPENPYNTSSRRIRDTSFANLTRTTMNNKSIEFSDMQHEISSTENNNRDETLHAFFAKLNNDPVNFREAMTGKDSKNWWIAVKEELNSMKKNEVWELVDRPQKDCISKRPNIIDSK